MKIKYFILLLVLVLICPVLLVLTRYNDYFYTSGDLRILDESVFSEETVNSQGFHSSYRSNIRSYDLAYSSLENEAQIKEKVYGGITSHHFLVSDLIAKFFKKIESQKNVRTIVIVGPNHFETGFYEALTSQFCWRTPFGDIEPDIELIAELTEDGLVKIDEKSLGGDHSISTLVPFVKKTFPDAKIVPIILKQDTYYETGKKIAERIYENSSGDVMVIASVDFSHNFPLREAQKKDEKSVLIINSFDLDGVSEIEVDSPISIYTLLYFLKLNGIEKALYSERSNSFFSSDISEEDNTVGYYWAHFGK